MALARRVGLRKRGTNPVPARMQVPGRLNMLYRTEFAVVAAAILMVVAVAPIAAGGTQPQAPQAQAVGARRGRGPLAGALLPCPMSLPCRASGEDLQRTTGTVDATDIPSGLPRPIMLVCPHSVPCIAPDAGPGADLHAPINASTQKRRASPRPIRSLRTSIITSPPAVRAKAPEPDNSNAEPRRSEHPAETAASTSPAVQVILGDDAANKRRAEQLLAEVSRVLKRVDKDKLSRQNAFLFKETTDFSRESRKALSRRDNLAALTLAEKARQLCPVLSPPGRPAGSGEPAVPH